MILNFTVKVKVADLIIHFERANKKMTLYLFVLLANNTVNILQLGRN